MVATLAAPELKEAICLHADRSHCRDKRALGAAAVLHLETGITRRKQRYAVSVLYCMQQMPWSIRN